VRVCTNTRHSRPSATAGYRAGTPLPRLARKCRRVAPCPGVSGHPESGLISTSRLVARLAHFRQLRPSRKLDGHVDDVPQPDEPNGVQQSRNLIVAELCPDLSPGSSLTRLPSPIRTISSASARTARSFVENSGTSRHLARGSSFACATSACRAVLECSSRQKAHPLIWLARISIRLRMSGSSGQPAR
jgi:hypothetical protein